MLLYDVDGNLSVPMGGGGISFAAVHPINTTRAAAAHEDAAVKLRRNGTQREGHRAEQHDFGSPPLVMVEPELSVLKVI